LVKGRRKIENKIIWTYSFCRLVSAILAILFFAVAFIVVIIPSLSLLAFDASAARAVALGPRQLKSSVTVAAAFGCEPLCVLLTREALF